jgi:DNA-binding NtrC family response regulator
VRELENVTRQALLLAGKYSIGVEHVRQALSRMGGAAAASEQSITAGIADYLARAKRGEIEGIHSLIIEEIERELFGQAIQLAQGNQAKAARWLGVSRLTMREKLNHFGLHPSGNAGQG